MASGQRRLPAAASSNSCVSLLLVFWEPLGSQVRVLPTHARLGLRQPGGATAWAFTQATGTQGARFLARGV